jgi:hypothetical protein
LFGVAEPRPELGYRVRVEIFDVHRRHAG